MKLFVRFFMLLALAFALHSCTPESKCSKDPEVLSYVYGVADVYNHNAKVSELSNNPVAAGILNSFNSIVNMFGGYKCTADDATRVSHTAQVECIVNREELGDSYTGFLVIYRVSLPKDNVYVLIDLVEFEDGRWEAKAIDAGESLSDVRSNITTVL